MSQNDTNVDQERREQDLNRLLRGFLRALRRFYPLVLALAILGSLGIAFYQNERYVPEYKAYCTFAVRVVNKAATGEANASYSVYYDKDLAEQMDKTFSYVLTGDLLRDQIRESMGSDADLGRVEAKSIEGSNVFMITTYAGTPEQAKKLLDAIMSVYMEAAQAIIGEMESEIVEEPVVSDTPHNKPSFVKNAALGFIFGLMPGLFLLVLYTYFRRTVLFPEDLEELVNMPCFGIIPLVNMKKMLNGTEADSHLGLEESAFRENARGIARKLETEAKKKGMKIILVTGTLPGEGKSTVSRVLASVLASWGRQVVLFDGDLRKPDLARRLGIRDREMPLEDVLRGKASLEQALHRFDGGNLILVGNTKPVKDATVVLSLPGTGEVLKRIAAAADYLILDAPPCGQMADAAILGEVADGILYVVQQDRAPSTQVAEAAAILNQTENKLLGYVLNGADAQSGDYGYGYGKYGYGKYGYGRYGYGRYGRYGHYGSREDREKE